MTDNTLDDAAAILGEQATLGGTWEYGGETYPLETVEPTLGDLEGIEDEIGANADETDAIRRMIDEYLAEPDVDADDIGISKLFALFEGMRDTWQQDAAFSDAEEAMPVESGNR